MKHWKRKDNARDGQSRSILQLEPLENRVMLSANPLDEFGDSFKSAALAQAEESGSTTISSDIYSYRDKDYINFTALGTGKLILDLDTTDSGLIPSVAVYNSQMKVVTKTNWRLHDGNSEIAFLAEEGQQYTVGISSVKKTSGDYTLTMNGPQTGQIWSEDYGDNRYEAENLTDAKSLSGEILNRSGNDNDYFSFTAKSDGQATIKLVPRDGTLDAALVVCRANGRCIAKSNQNGLGESESVTLNVIAGTRYYIKTDGVGKSQGLYDLELSGAGLEPEVEMAGAELAGNYENSYAVLIGASRYEKVQNLEETETDVQLVRQSLVESLNIDPDNIITLTGDRTSVNSKTIANAVNWLNTNTGPGDLAIFYYSGHGDYGRDYEVNDMESLYLPGGDNITEAELKAMLTPFDNETAKLVILDSCYSGGFISLGSSIANTTVLASSQFDQLSWGYVERFNGNAGNGSVFTSWLTKGLNENKVANSSIDSNSDGKVSFGEAYLFADRQVRAYTSQSWSQQDPIAKMLYGDIIL